MSTLAYFIWLSESIATILCCAKLVFLLFTISLACRGPTRGRGALLLKRRNSKWSFTNEPELRFRFYILVEVGPTIRLAGTVPV